MPRIDPRNAPAKVNQALCSTDQDTETFRQQSNDLTVCAGRQYDQFGSAFDWWSAGTDAKFEERAQCFVKQYSSYRVSELNKTVGNL